LPGLDWINGLIIEEDLSFGESLLGLSRRYRISEEDLARLNRIVSPDQLFVGYPALLPTERGEQTNDRRVPLGISSSLLEFAVASNSNVWSLAAANRLSGTWDAVPGDVLHVPGSAEGGGPSALPSPVGAITISSDGFVQGRTTVIQVASSEPVLLDGELMGSGLHFFSNEQGVNIALQGLHALAEPGFYPMRLTVADQGGEFSFSQAVRVLPGGYGFETITVDPSFLEPTVEQAESARINEIVGVATPEKLWSGYFQVPSPFGDTFNSLFGTRRSFNGSDFIYFHAGLDFGGGLGVQIFAPAAGQVVFAAPLEVRGNATIINHGWGVYSGYWHQSEILVQEGQMVEPGQVIGIVGNTGRSSGAHLHWELWVGGVQVDPLDWLARIYP
jgi:murein DD-endopeptidase MepM/ murein hydrolase activator NlpD